MTSNRRLQASNPLLIAALAVAVAWGGVVFGGETSRVAILLDLHGMSRSNHTAFEVKAESDSDQWSGLMELSGDSTLVADLRPGRLWTFSVDGEEVWAPERAVFIDENVTEVVLSVWPKGSVVGRLSWPQGEAPDQMDLWLWSAEERQGESPAFAHSECKIKDAAFECPLPQGEWDFKLRVPSHVSFLYWARTIKSEPVKLGNLRLVRGASVLGWVAPAVNPIADSPCTVELMPFGAALDDTEVGRLSSASARTQPDKRGFFKFDGVAPGRYVVSAKQAGNASAKVFPVDVLKDAETTIPGLITLHPPVRIELQVIPPLDPLDRPWELSLFEWGRMGPFQTQRMPLLTDHVSEAGTWVSGPLSPGKYFLALATSLGSTWDFREVLLDTNDELVQLVTDVIPVRGRVSLGETPIAARIAFIRSADEEVGFGGSTINTQANLNGQFKCDLPGEGEWTVSVDSEEPLVQRKVQGVYVARVGGSPVANVDIELVDVRLIGSVIDVTGEGVPQAVVVLRNLENREEAIGAQTNDDGRFEVRGLAEGRYSASAQEGDRQSDNVVFGVEKEGSPDDLVLRLREDMVVRGRVVSGGGMGVPGASVFWMTAVASSHSAANTGLDGGFEATIPREAPTVLFHVMAPGYALHVQRWDGRRENFELALSQLGGTVILHGSADVTASGRFPALFRDGLIIPWIIGWAGLHGSALPSEPDAEWPIPMLEPGVYAACAVTPADIPAAIEAAATGFTANCDTGTVSPGNILELDFD